MWSATATGSFSELLDGLLLPYVYDPTTPAFCTYRMPASLEYPIRWVRRFKNPANGQGRVNILWYKTVSVPPAIEVSLVSAVFDPGPAFGCTQQFNNLSTTVSTVPLIGMGTCPSISYRPYREVAPARAAFPNLDDSVLDP